MRHIIAGLIAFAVLALLRIGHRVEEARPALAAAARGAATLVRDEDFATAGRIHETGQEVNSAD